jgi:hypothetical protein
MDPGIAAPTPINRGPRSIAIVVDARRRARETIANRSPRVVVGHLLNEDRVRIRRVERAEIRVERLRVSRRIARVIVPAPSRIRAKELLRRFAGVRLASVATKSQLVVAGTSRLPFLGSPR